MPKDREHIERHAYKIWEDEGRPHGRHEDHWQRARQEVGAEEDGESSSAPEQVRGADELETRQGRQIDDNIDDLGRKVTDTRRKASPRRKPRT